MTTKFEEDKHQEGQILKTKIKSATVPKKTTFMKTCEDLIII